MPVLGGQGEQLEGKVMDGGSIKVEPLSIGQTHAPAIRQMTLEIFRDSVDGKELENLRKRNSSLILASRDERA